MDSFMDTLKMQEMSVKKEALVEKLDGKEFQLVGFTREGNDTDNKKNEDSYKFKLISLPDSPESTVAVVAMGDGVGKETSPFSKVGADAVTEEAVAIIEKNINSIVKRLRPKKKHDKTVGRFVDRNILIPIKKKWVKRIQEHSGIESPNLMEYASTLMIGIVTSDFTAIIRMGDNNAYMQKKDGEVWKVRFKGDTEGANGVPDGKRNRTLTIAHPSPNVGSELTVIERSDQSNSVLFATDGLAESTTDDPVSTEEYDKLLKSIFETNQVENLKMLVSQKKDDVSFVRVTSQITPENVLAKSSDIIADNQ